MRPRTPPWLARPAANLRLAGRGARGWAAGGAPARRTWRLPAARDSTRPACHSWARSAPPGTTAWSPLESQPARDTLAGDGCCDRELRRQWRPAGCAAAAGGRRRFRLVDGTSRRVAPMVRGQRDDRGTILDHQHPWPWRKKVTQGMLPVGKSISGGGANERKPGDGDRVPSGDKKRGIVGTLGGVKGGRDATCNQSRDRPCKSWSRRRAVAQG